MNLRSLAIVRPVGCGPLILCHPCVKTSKLEAMQENSFGSTATRSLSCGCPDVNCCFEFGKEGRPNAWNEVLDRAGERLVLHKNY